MEQEKKNNGSIDYMLYCDIEMYCKENELDLGKFMNKALSRGFTILAYGETPTSSKKLNKPVEVIKTVEKIVERIVKVSDDAKVNELLKDVEHLYSTFLYRKEAAKHGYDKNLSALEFHHKNPSENVLEHFFSINQDYQH